MTHLFYQTSFAPPALTPSCCSMPISRSASSGGAARSSAREVAACPASRAARTYRGYGNGRARQGVEGGVKGWKGGYGVREGA